jgi:ketosteroid isomerase-like protein
MARRWVLLGALALSLLSAGCFSAGTMVGRGEMVGVTTQLNDSRAIALNDHKQLVLVTNQLNDERPVIDEYQVKQIEVTYHLALATKNIDLMMTIFADDAVLTTPTGDKYAGAAAIRTFFSTKSVAMQPQNHWAALVPAYKVQVSVLGNSADLTFECHLVDIATSRMMLEHQIDMTLAHQADKWLVTSMRSKVIQLS